jgi:hypothetical protein
MLLLPVVFIVRGSTEEGIMVASAVASCSLLCALGMACTAATANACAAGEVVLRAASSSFLWCCWHSLWTGEVVVVVTTCCAVIDPNNNSVMLFLCVSVRTVDVIRNEGK